MYLKLIALAVVVVVFTLMWGDLQAKKASIATLKGELAVAEQKIVTFQGNVTSLNGIIAGLEQNIADIKRQAAKWKTIATETTDMYRRIVANQQSDKPCEVINAEYKQMAIDITDQFNNSVRGKVQRPAANGDHSETKVLSPPSVPAGAGEAGVAGPAAR
jgi:prophage DNA circulation protein